jgi:hypothetical protein
MTEKELESLGFDLEGYCDFDGEWHYYSLQLASGFGFISCANNQVGEDGQWYVDFFDSDPLIRFTDYDELRSIISLVETRIVK